MRVGASMARGDGGLALEVLSVHPPVWRVADFLSAAESEWYVEEMKRNGGMRRSKTSNDGGAQGMLAPFAEASRGGAALTVAELRDAFRALLDMPRLGDGGAAELLGALDADGDGAVAEDEWSNERSWGAVHRLVGAFRRSSPEKFARFSQQGWVPSSPPSVAARIATLLGIPPALLPNGTAAGSGATGSESPFGEHVQVLRYGERGHYTCHHDSGAAEDGQPSALQRAYTVLIHLRDVPLEQGGGTWFPGAGLDAAGRWSEDDWGALETRCTLDNRCRSGGADGDGLVVPSVRGQAIIWQNHRTKNHPQSGPWGVGAARGWQDLDWSTLHAGCDVAPGSKLEKWVANQWVWREAVENICGIGDAAQTSAGGGAEEGGEEEEEGDIRSADEDEDDDDRPDEL